MKREPQLEELDRPGPVTCQWCHRPATHQCDQVTAIRMNSTDRGRDRVWKCRALMCGKHTRCIGSDGSETADVCPDHVAETHPPPRQARIAGTAAKAR